MRLFVTVVLLLLPGVFAGYIHHKLIGKKDSGVKIGVIILYAALLDAALCGGKLMRGAEMALFLDWFSPPLSFTFYLLISIVLALVLPMLYVLVKEKRLALRLVKPGNMLHAKAAKLWVLRDRKRVFHVLLHIALVLVVGILIGGILVTAVYMLPLGNIQDNVRRSAATVQSEGSYPFLYENWRSTRLDNFTDSIMMLIAAYSGDQGLIQNAMLSTYTRFADHDPAQGLVKWSTGAVDGMQTHSYSRYWHGYLVWLKPLLEIMDYQQIRVLNTIALGLLMAAVLLMMFIKGWKRLIIPFLIMLLFLTPNAVFQSFQFSWIVYVFLVSSLVLMLRFEKFKQRNTFYVLFVITGMATSYVDFLTYPLITLGVPLVLYLVLQKRRSAWQGVTDVVGLALAWGIGYVGMWAGKWLLCTLLTDSNVLLSVQGNINARMSFAYVEETFNLMDIIQRNIEAYNHWMYLGPFLLCLILYSWLYGRDTIQFADRCYQVKYQTLNAALWPMVLVALSPFVWFLVASNHTYIHYWYAHRTLAVSAFAALAFWAQSIRLPKQQVR